MLELQLSNLYYYSVYEAKLTKEAYKFISNLNVSLSSHTFVLGRSRLWSSLSLIFKLMAGGKSENEKKVPLTYDFYC